MEVAQKGNKEIAQFLLENGADLNSINELEETALMIAIQEGHKDIVQLFIEKAVDPEFINEALVMLYITGIRRLFSFYLKRKLIRISKTLLKIYPFLQWHYKTRIKR